MAHRKIDGIQQYATGSGTGNLVLGAATGLAYRTCQVGGLLIGDTMYARIENAALPGEWEVSLITRLSETDISRTFDSKSTSATGMIITFTVGTMIISSVVAAGANVAEDTNGDATVTRNFSAQNLMATVAAYISGAAATARSLYFRTGSSLRWVLGVNNTAEGGSDAGSNFAIYRYKDDGTFIDQPFGITRQTGSAYFTNNSAIALAVGQTLGGANPAFQVDTSVASQAAGLKVTGAIAAGTVDASVISSGAAANLQINAKGTGTITLGNVSTGAVSVSRALTAAGQVTGNSTVAPVAGGALTTGLRLSSTANLGIFLGSGAPTIAAAQGSLYIRTDGTTTNDRFYVRGSAGWIAVTTAS